MLVGNFEWVHLRKLVSELGHTPVWAQFRNFVVGFADTIVWAPVYTPVWELSYTLVAQRVDSLPSIIHILRSGNLIRGIAIWLGVAKLGN